MGAPLGYVMLTGFRATAYSHLDEVVIRTLPSPTHRPLTRNPAATATMMLSLWHKKGGRL